MVEVGGSRGRHKVGGGAVNNYDHPNKQTGRDRDRVASHHISGVAVTDGLPDGEGVRGVSYSLDI